jgi:hypothetical protein
MTPVEWRSRVLRILRRRNRFQFGQPPATTTLTLGGKSACVDTCIQLIVWMADSKVISQNMVRRASGAPVGEPTQVEQALRALHHFGMPYEYRVGLTAGQVLDIARNRGPVIICHRYWSYPQWRGYTYAGKTLDGHARNDYGKTVRVGLSRPIARSGLTQWTFRDGHAALVSADGYRRGKRVAIVRDPNHNSAARPERPAFDILAMSQLNRMLRSWPGDSLVLAPSRRLF